MPNSAYSETVWEQYSELERALAVVVLFVDPGGDPLDALLQRSLHPGLESRGERRGERTD